MKLTHSKHFISCNIFGYNLYLKLGRLECFYKYTIQTFHGITFSVRCRSKLSIYVAHCIWALPTDFNSTINFYNFRQFFIPVPCFCRGCSATSLCSHIFDNHPFQKGTPKQSFFLITLVANLCNSIFTIWSTIKRLSYCYQTYSCFASFLFSHCELYRLSF